MFKKSRIKIVVSIMSILVALWVGTLGVIYTSSYVETARQNERMLQLHSQMYTLSGELENAPPAGRPLPGGAPDFNPDFDPDFVDVGKWLDGRFRGEKKPPICKAGRAGIR